MFARGMINDIYLFRGFILGSVKREFVSRYRGTQFGFIWQILQPLSMILIYTVVFSKVMRASLPGHGSGFAYSIYLCSGVLTWGLFSELLSRSIRIFVSNGDMLKKINFPKICLPVIVVISSFVNFLIIFFLFLIFLLLSGTFPGFSVLGVAPLIIIITAFATGLGILLGTVNVFYRDVEKIMEVILQFWFWMTPIVYAIGTLPSFASSLLKWNPMWPVIDSMHVIFLDGTFPDWNKLLYPFILSLFFMVTGLLAFRKLNGEIVDEL